jgi:hypothetical protein
VVAVSLDKVQRCLSFQLPGFRTWLQRQRGIPVNDLWCSDNEVTG